MKKAFYLCCFIVGCIIGLIFPFSFEGESVYTTPPIPKIETPAWKQADIPVINEALHGVTRMRQERENGAVSMLSLPPGEFALKTHPRARDGWLMWDNVK